MLARRGNDLTDAAISRQPAIADVLAFLRGSDGVRHAAMSGSGATCFALYDTIDDARRAAVRRASRVVAPRRDTGLRMIVAG